MAAAVAERGCQGMTTPPSTCAAVTFDMRDEHYGDSAWWTADIGDLLWDPKGGDGHVLVAEVRCGEKHNGRTVDCGCGGWVGPCSALTQVCECGEDGSWRDHHYEILARLSGSSHEDHTGEPNAAQ